MIEKKFTMLSTKEWLQLFQYKLSPEREKELHERANHDPFLKEAVETITTQDNRPIAFQSLTYLIHQIEDATGVSESNIATGKTSSSYNTGSLSAKTLWMILAGLLLVALLASGIYYYVNLPDSELTADDLVEVDSTATTQYVDTSNRPLDVIPNMPSTTDTPLTSITNPIKAASSTKKSSSNSTYSSDNTTTSNTSSSLTVEHKNPSAAGSTGDGNRERELFQQAQDKFKTGDREGAKQILNNLKGYDNPMKNQAEKILHNMDGNQ